MKAVIDTNVFVSGIFWKGPPFRVLNAWRDGKFKLVVSTEIFVEYRRVFRELAVKRPGVDPGAILDLISIRAEVVEAPGLPRQICKDPDDDKFLAAALAAKASYVVSGDRALLETTGFQGIHVENPGRFLKLL